MIQTDGAWLRKLAKLVDAGEVEVARVELNNRGVILGVLQPGTFAAKQARCPKGAFCVHDVLCPGSVR